MKMRFALCLMIGAVLATGAFAHPPVVEASVVHMDANGTARVSVTLRHQDTGWTHYADGWRLELGDGTIFGTRILHHPHVNEQPFTRSLGNLRGLNAEEIYVRAKCSTTGWAPSTTPLGLKGEN